MKDEEAGAMIWCSTWSPFERSSLSVFRPAAARAELLDARGSFRDNDMAFDSLLFWVSSVPGSRLDDTTSADVGRSRNDGMAFTSISPGPSPVSSSRPSDLACAELLDARRMLT